MNRNTDLTRQTPSHAQSDVSSALQAAAALIALAMHESHPPIEELSGALARLAEFASARPEASASAADRNALARELAICIEHLQFHDRLMQQLTQVRDLLASLAAETLPGVSDVEAWNVLVENIRSRFTSDSHRILFNLLLPVSSAHVAVPALHANEGSIELF